MAAPSPVRADYRAALSAYESGAYEAALREFRALAQSGDPAAQYHLGLMFKDGRGVRKEPVTALGWFMCAAGSDGQVGTDAARSAEQLASALDRASVSAAQERARTCRATAETPVPHRTGEESERPGIAKWLDWETFKFELSQFFRELSRVEIARPEGGVSLDRTRTSEPSKSSYGSFFAVPDRRSVWSKVFYLPADGTVVGSQHVAWELGANDLFRELRAVARDSNNIALGMLAVLWWFLIGKAVLSIGRALTSVFRRSGAE